MGNILGKKDLQLVVVKAVQKCAKNPEISVDNMKQFLSIKPEHKFDVHEVILRVKFLFEDGRNPKFLYSQEILDGLDKVNY